MDKHSDFFQIVRKRRISQILLTLDQCSDNDGDDGDGDDDDERPKDARCNLSSTMDRCLAMYSS